MKNLIVIRHSGDLERLKFCESSIKKSKIDYCVVQEQYRYETPRSTRDGNQLKVYGSFLSENSLRKLNNNKTGWVCGDYIFYAAKQYFPGYDYYWVMDDDLCLNLDVDKFIERADALSADLIGPSFGKTEEDSFWGKKMLPYYPEAIYVMLFCLIRLSSHSIDFLAAERKKFLDVEDSEFPNDEAFVATSLANNGYTCLNARDVFPEFNPFFTAGTPVLYEEVALRRFENKIIHPICDSKRAMSKIGDEKFGEDRKIDLLFRWYVHFGLFYVESNFQKNTRQLFVDTSKSEFFPKIPVLYKKFNHLLLVNKWFYTSRLLVLEFVDKNFKFALDVHWNGDVSFIARNDEARNFLEKQLRGEKLIAKNGVFLGELAVFQKYLENHEDDSKIIAEMSFLADYLMSWHQRQILQPLVFDTSSPSIPSAPGLALMAEAQA